MIVAFFFAINITIYILLHHLLSIIIIAFYIQNIRLVTNNLLSAEALTRLSRYVAHREYSPTLLDMLPRAGIDGSLTWRMLGGPAVDRVRAKTGSMSNIRNISGFVTTADGSELAVTLLSAGFVQPQVTAIQLQDTALEMLATHEQGRAEDARRRWWWQR